MTEQSLVDYTKLLCVIDFSTIVCLLYLCFSMVVALIYSEWICIQHVDMEQININNSFLVHLTSLPLSCVGSHVTAVN